MKKLLLVSVFLFVVAPSTHAACIPDPGDPGVCYEVDGSTCTCPTTTGASGGSGFTALAPITGLTDAEATSVVNSDGFANFFNNLYKYLIGLAAVIAIIQIIWAGLRIATNQDNVSQIIDSKGKIYNAIFGLILVLSPVIVFSIINPNILNLSLNLEPLATAPGVSVGGGGGGGTIDPATGCTVTGTLFKKASCSTQQKAQDFAAACSSGSGKVMSCQQENSSGCVDTTYFATCDTTGGSVTGPYVFIDTSQSGFSFTGIFNAISGFYQYEPLARSASNPNNGQDVLNFTSTCRTDGGVTCLKANFLSTTCTFSTGLPTSQSNRCYNATLVCVSDNSSFYSTGACSANPQFRIIE